jgi:hypothetical protein
MGSPKVLKGFAIGSGIEKCRSIQLRGFVDRLDLAEAVFHCCEAAESGASKRNWKPSFVSRDA